MSTDTTNHCPHCERHARETEKWRERFEQVQDQLNRKIEQCLQAERERDDCLHNYRCQSCEEHEALVKKCAVMREALEAIYRRRVSYAFTSDRVLMRHYKPARDALKEIKNA